MTCYISCGHVLRQCTSAPPTPLTLRRFPHPTYHICSQKEGLRLNDFAGFQGRYKSPRMRSQLEVYKNIAEKYDMSIHQMATAFVHNK